MDINNMDNLEKKLRMEGNYFCSACHQCIDEYDYEYYEWCGREQKQWKHEYVTVRDEDGEYICTCNVCDETESILISESEVVERKKIMLSLFTKVIKKISAHEKSR